MTMRRLLWFPNALLRPRAVLLLGLLCLGGIGLAEAKPWWMRGVEASETDFLPPDVAFRVAAHIDGDVVRVRWIIADKYYLYRDKMSVEAASPDLTLGEPQLPSGVRQTDSYLGTEEVYFQQVEAVVPFTRLDFGAHPMQIKVMYQGCAQAGLCYPRIAKVLFPDGGNPLASGLPNAHASSHPWECIAIGGGALAFLLAGLWLRKARSLPLPSA